MNVHDIPAIVSAGFAGGGTGWRAAKEYASTALPDYGSSFSVYTERRTALIWRFARRGAFVGTLGGLSWFGLNRIV
jgi:hypothetical protein